MKMHLISTAKSSVKSRARGFADRVAQPYVDQLSRRIGRLPETPPHDDRVTPGGRGPTNDRFRSLEHELRSIELGRLPRGAGTVVSVGPRDSSHFEWVRHAVGDVGQHIAVASVERRPGDLPHDVRWVANTANDMCDVETGSVDLLLGGQTPQLLWAHELTGFLCEANRVLRDGGRLVLDGANRKITQHLRWSHGGHTVELDRDEISQLLELAGFTIERSTGIWGCAIDGRTLELDEGLDDPVILGHRIADGPRRPDDAFAWWVTARRHGDVIDQDRLRAEVDRFYERHWSERVSRGFFPGVGVDLTVPSATAGEVGRTLPFPISPGSWEVAVQLTKGDWSSVGSADITIEAPDGHVVFRGGLATADLDDDRLVWKFDQPHRLLATTVALDLTTSSGVTIAFPLSLKCTSVRTSCRDLDLDRFVEMFDRGLISLEMRDELSVAIDPPVELLADPTSDEYRAWVLSTWSRITSRSTYDATLDEAFEVPLEEYLRRPYPHSSGDPSEVGNYLGAIAWLLRTARPEPSHRVLEYGSGWGHLALNLAMMGCDVTTVDLNPESVELLRTRCDRWDVPIDVRLSSFLDFRTDDTFDAIMFFEAFHHCDRPLELLDRCTDMLRPGGRLLFLAEPVYEGFYCPWGVRLDGHALYMARHSGWLELGFERTFFEAQLAARGFTVSEHHEPQLVGYGSLLVATRAG